MFCRVAEIVSDTGSTSLYPSEDCLVPKAPVLHQLKRLADHQVGCPNIQMAPAFLIGPSLSVQGFQFLDCLCRVVWFYSPVEIVLVLPRRIKDDRAKLSGNR